MVALYSYIIIYFVGLTITYIIGKLRNDSDPDITAML